MNTICKEHEWEEVAFTATGIEAPVTQVMCRNCGFPKQPSKDFHIEENLKIIEDSNWDEIFKEFMDKNPFMALSTTLWNEFYKWMKQNYNPPTKK